MLEIKLINGKKFYCDKNQSIIDAAIKNDISLEHSCKNGRCGVCIADVLNGDTAITQAEEYIHLNQEFSSSILTCSRTPLSDITLSIEDLGDIGKVQAMTLPCKIDSIDKVSLDVIKLTLRLPPNNNFTFIPGQYINLIKDDFRRSYSIANKPNDNNKIELHIKRFDGGLMSEYLFKHAKLEDILRFEGPFGTFSLRKNSKKNVIFIATGTGIAPILSMIESMSDKKSDKDIFIFWGAQYARDLYIDPRKKMNSIKYFPVLSREEKNNYYYGYVQDALINSNIDLKKSCIYACGSENMIKDTLQLLIKNNYERKYFLSDAFVSSD